jgi:hypothetical protein
LTGKAAVVARELVQSAAALSKQADQDASTRQRMRDLDTALAYLAAARSIAPDNVLTARSGIKVEELLATLRAQDQATPSGVV